MDLRFLADLLDVGDSTLSQTLTVMRDAGLVEVREESVGRRNRTWAGVTDEGRRAFNRHVEALGEIIASGT
ncbi:transcriptional regulator [Streptomyces viridosporus]|uniref:transcriptional regulator n=1 Tax=Streptomyces viridosporus TaxID=67581 RepID=UPI001C3FBB25|nr:transcriptional regulator [Streptomyces viridosporus]